MVSGLEVSMSLPESNKIFFQFDDILVGNKIIHVVWKYRIPSSYLWQD